MYCSSSLSLSLKKYITTGTSDEISNLLTLLEGLITIRFDEDSLNSLIVTSSNKNQDEMLERLEKSLERFVVRYVQSDPQPDCFCVLENSNLKDLILALDRVLADGLIKIDEKNTTTNNNGDVRSVREF